MNDDQARTAYHESGHAAVAHALGRRIEFLRIRPGAHYAGIAPYVPPRLPSNGKLHRPAILQDASFRLV
jgi:ATP-dependent Zn protease